jgi:CRP-like cAMP-binding protein
MLPASFDAAAGTSRDLVQIPPPMLRFCRKESFPSVGVWLLQSGLVRSLTWLESGEVVTLGVWGPGDLVGVGLSEVEPYQIEPLTAGLAMRLEGQVPPPLMLTYTRNLEHLLVINRAHRVCDRLHQLLHWLGRRFGQPDDRGLRLDLPLTHQLLSELVGTTRVTVTKLLSQFEAAGWLRRNQRQLWIVSTGN